MARAVAPKGDWLGGITAGGLGVSAVAMLGRAVDRRARMLVTAGWPDVGRA